jgi:hypothetical protein
MATQLSPGGPDGSTDIRPALEFDVGLSSFVMGDRDACVDGGVPPSYDRERPPMIADRNPSVEVTP